MFNHLPISPNRSQQKTLPFGTVTRPCTRTCLLRPAADFADAFAVGVDADVVDGEGAVGVGAVLGALARRPGRLERRRHRQLREPVPEVLQSDTDLMNLGVRFLPTRVPFSGMLQG